MGPTSDYVEREVKLAADLSFTLPDLRRIVAGTTRLPEQTLRTVYFDTPDLRLWGRGITLRHRLGEEGSMGKWTLKLPQEEAGRTLDRTEQSWEGRKEQFPVAATRVLQGVVRRAVLGQVVELESTRQRLVLRDADGTSLGEIDDDIVTVKSGPREGVTFRQIELEFGIDQSETHPGADVVDAVLKELTKAGARADGEQKFAVALGLGTAGQGTSTSGGAGHDGSLAGAVKVSLSSGLDRLLDNDVPLRVEPSDPPARAVHQARVAARRLRSDLKTFRPLLDAVWLDHTTTELKWLGNVLGPIRDADVLAQHIAPGNSERPIQASGQDELLSRLAQQRRRFSGELGDALESGRYLSLLERLHAGAAAPPFSVNGKSPPTSAHAPRADSRASDMMPPLVRSQWKELRRRVRKAGHHPSDKQLHRIRIASKQLRYAAEAAIPAVGRRARRTAGQAERLQTILGAHHDAVAAEAWLRREAFRGTAVASFAAGGLVAEQRRRQRRQKGRWESAWHKLEKKNKWLR